MINEETLARWRREDEAFDRRDDRLTRAETFIAGIAAGLLIAMILIAVGGIQ